MEEALKLMIVNEQKATWPKEYDQLQEGLEVDNTSDIFQLNPILDDDVIKMRTRLEYSQLLPEQTKFPIILPKKSRIADLIIYQEHVQTSHAVPEQTRRNVRTKYWILGGKRKINTVIKRMCMNRECRKWQLKPLNQQLPPLPEQRMDLQCFEAMSVDALGPIETKMCAECHHNAHCIKCEKKEKKSSDGKPGECKYKKVYIILFADMVSRAVDLQLMQNRTTESFLMAFRRMTSVKSTPRFILSDNAAEFVRADKEIHEVMELITSEEVRKQHGEQGIEWRFTPARTPTQWVDRSPH